MPHCTGGCKVNVRLKLLPTEPHVHFQFYLMFDTNRIGLSVRLESNSVPGATAFVSTTESVCQSAVLSSQSSANGLDAMSLTAIYCIWAGGLACEYGALQTLLSVLAQLLG